MHMIIILILLAVNYAILVIAKLLSDTPQPFTFPHGGIHILIMVWFIEVVILGLLLTNRAMGQMLHYQQQAYRMQKRMLSHGMQSCKTNSTHIFCSTVSMR